MRIVLTVVIVAFIFAACKKDNYSTSPQIKYKSVSPNFSDNSINSVSPVVTFSLTDAEGDLGITGTDTARIYLKNILTGEFDSLDFPDLKDISKKDFKADILASVSKVLSCGPGPSGHIDTLFYEIYVKDFKKNQSNTIVTGDPTFYQCP